MQDVSLRPSGTGRLLGLVCLIVSSLLVGSLASSGQTVYCVRAGATGAGTGRDWTNAYPVLPSGLARGATYLVADGAYGSYRFDDALVEAAGITVKKATAQEHGPDTGWQDSYGDGTATWNDLSFTTSHWIFDGTVGSGRSGYGFEVTPATPRNAITVEAGVSNVTLRHVNAHVYPENTINEKMTAFAHIFYAAGGSSQITVANSYLHAAFGCHILTATRADFYKLEHNVFSNNESTAAYHSGAICDHNSDNWVVRYNEFHDIDGTAVMDFLEGPDTAENVEFYANVVRDSTISAIIAVLHDGANERTARNWKVYNNSFVNIKGFAAIKFESSSGYSIDVRNNYWYCNRGTNTDYVNYAFIHGPGVSYDYNHYSNCAHPWAFVPGAHEPPMVEGPACNLSGDDTDPFLDWRSGNLRLARPTPPGMLLSLADRKDPDGRTRGVDGNWDRGAFEFHATFAPQPPSGVRVMK